MKRIICFLLTLCLVLSANCFVFASGESEIAYPSNGAWLDPYNDITVKWTTPSAGLSNRITIKNERTGNYIVNNKTVSGTSYTVPSNTFDFEERYKIWVGTYDGSSALGYGNYVVVNINDRYSSKMIYEEADFIYPENNDTVPCDSDLKIKIDGDSNLAYRITVRNVTTNKVIVDDSTSKTSYTVDKDMLTAGHSYKAWIGTYKKASEGKKEFGQGKYVNFKVEEEEVVEASQITFPKHYDWLDTTEAITVKWNSAISGAKYTIAVIDDSKDVYYVEPFETTATSFTIPENTIKPHDKIRVVLDTHYNGKKIGSNEIVVYTNDIEYQTAVVSYPAEGQTVDPDKSITIKLSNTLDEYCYRFYMRCLWDGEYLYDDELIDGDEFTIPAGLLDYGREYRIGVDTYINETEESSVGYSSRVKFKTLEKPETLPEEPEESEEAEDPEEEITEPAKITSPKSGEWLDSTKQINVKWENLGENTQYSVTLIDATSGKIIVPVFSTEASYSYITTTMLKPEQKYTVTVTTIKDGKNIGKDSVSFYTNGLDYEEAYFKSPTDGATVDPEQNLTLKLANTVSGLNYCISVVNNEDGSTLYRNMPVSGTSFTIPADTLNYDTEYKLWVGTYYNEEAVGKGNYIYVTTSSKNEELRAAEIISPSDGEMVNPFDQIKISWNAVSEDCEYSVSVIDIHSKHLKHHDITRYTNSTVIPRALKANNEYKIELKTYLDEEQIGSTDVVYISTAIEQNVQIISPLDGDTLDPAKGIEVIISSINESFTYKLFAMCDDNDAICFGDINGSYFIPRNKLQYGKTYKIWIEEYYNNEKISECDYIYINTKANDTDPNKTITAYLNGKQIMFDVPPLIEDGRTLVPVRAIFEAMGMNVDWDETTRTVTGTGNGHSIILRIDDCNAEVDGKIKMLDVPSRIIDSRTLVPIRFISENLGATVDWDNVERAIYITYVVNNFGSPYENPTAQQIYNYVYNRIHDRSIYIEAPDVINAIMTMIWAENSGKHYDSNGEVYRSSTNDYGLCQLNGSEYKDLNWQENANLGIDKYASAYYCCMTEELYMQAVERGVNKGYSLEESRARTAYCMYNGGFSVYSRWLEENVSQDLNFKSKWDSKSWLHDSGYSSNNSKVISQRIDKLYNTLKNTYFTVDRTTGCGKKSSGHGCDNCKLSLIVETQWFKNEFGSCDVGKEVPVTYYKNGGYTSDGMSCLGFSHFALWYIFKTLDYNTTDTGNMKTKKIGTFSFDAESISQNAKIGDNIRLTKSEDTGNGHSVIFIGVTADETGIEVLDCNWSGAYNCMVSRHTIKFNNYSFCSISRVGVIS